MRAWLVIFILAGAGVVNALVAGCSPAPPAKPVSTSIRVVVSIPPLKGIIEPLLPAGSTIEVLIPPGASEHGYEIPPGRLVALAQADLVVYIGLGMEPQIEKALHERPNANQRVIEFAAVVGIEPGHEHAAPAPDAHSHAADPHLWLDPDLVASLLDELKRQIADLMNARGATPVERDYFNLRVGLVRAKLSEFKEKCLHDLYARSRRTIVVTHDAWGRFADVCGLKTIALKGLTAGEPTPADLKAAIDTIAREHISTIFVEPQISPALAQRIAAATGAKVATLDPLGDGDWFALMNKNLEAIVKALSEPN